MSSWKPTGKIPGSYAARGEPLTMSEPKWNNLTPEEQAEWRDAVATQDKPKAAPAQAAAAAAAPTPTPENIAPATSTPAPSDAGDLSDPLRRSIAQANARKAAAEQQPKIPPEYLQNKINVADAGAKVLRDLGVTREHMQRLKTSNPQAYEDVFTNVAKLPGVSKQANYPLTDEVTRGMMIDRLPSESTLPDYPHFQQ